MKRKKRLFLMVIPVLVICWRCSEQEQSSQKNSLNSSEENRIAFGKKLFFDKRLSGNNTISCASCHRPELAFTDGLPKSRGVNGATAMRNAPSLLNAAFFKRYMYDGEIKTLEEQALVPIQDHREMAGSMKQVVKKLSADPEYRLLAQSVFNRKLDAYVITRALSSYERSLISRNSRFDQYRAGAKSALTPDELAGWKLFSQKLYCTECHSGIDFTNYRTLSNGLYTDYGEDQGRYRINGLEEDRGTFKVPSLRNVALTAPYMHDGSFRNLREVIAHYARGGTDFLNKSNRIRTFRLTELEINQLELFLQSLTDTSYTY